MEEKEIFELLEFLATDYGRWYLAGLVNGMSILLKVLKETEKKQKGKYMSQQHKKWIQLVKDKLNSEGMTQTHLARACGVKKPTISELLKYGKGSDRLKNRVCDVLGIDESWVDLGEQEEDNETKTVSVQREKKKAIR